MKVSKTKYTILLKEIRQLVEQSRHNVARIINTELLFTYWHVGRLIAEKEKQEKYDEQALWQMLLDISKQLTRELGKGFSRTNLFYMRKLFLVFHSGVQTVSERKNLRSVQTLSERKINQSHNKSKSVQTQSGHTKKLLNSITLTVSDQLSWSHYCELMKCNDEIETSFFYHRILKCFVLIDLKVKAVKHTDIGQMNPYLNYFETEQNVENDNPPIGIILTKHKDDITLEYATRGITNKIFVSKYQLYLPEKIIKAKNNRTFTKQIAPHKCNLNYYTQYAKAGFKTSL